MSDFNILAGQPGYTQALRAYTTENIPSFSGTTIAPNIGMPGIPGGIGSLDFSQKVGLGLQGLGTVANLVLGLKQLSLANKQYGLQKRAFETNLTNQVRSYNDALGDRLRARAMTETGNTNGVEQQIKERSLTTGM